MKTKFFAIANLVSVIFLIAWNGYANTGNYNGKTVGELSAEYSNLFTPASYAFSIWGIIFLMLVVFGVYGVVTAFARHPEPAAGKAKPPETIDGQTSTTKIAGYRTDFVNTTAPWFLLANIFCAAWVAFWLDELVSISVICMLGILICLLVCVKKLDLEIWDAPLPVIAFVWWPLSLYAGWISVATIANIAAWLNGSYDIAISTQVYATLAMMTVAFLVNAGMVFYRNMREFALVGVWALVAIYMRFKDPIDIIDSDNASLIATTALSLAVILGLIIMVHGARNFKTNPFGKYLASRAP
jgi:hypothetical protein